MHRPVFQFPRVTLSESEMPGPYFALSAIRISPSPYTGVKEVTTDIGESGFWKHYTTSAVFKADF